MTSFSHLNIALNGLWLTLHISFGGVTITLSYSVASSYNLRFWISISSSLRISILALNCRGLVLLKLLRRALDISRLWLLKYSLFCFWYLHAHVIRLSSGFISSYFNRSSLFVSFVMYGVRKVRIIMTRLRSGINISGLWLRMNVSLSWLGIFMLISCWLGINISSLWLGVYVSFCWLSILVLISCWLGINISSMMILSLRSALNISSLWLLVSLICIVVHCRICLFHIRIIIIIYWCI